MEMFIVGTDMIMVYCECVALLVRMDMDAVRNVQKKICIPYKLIGSRH